MQKIILTAIKLYQYLISPILGPRCRFYPSCSHYFSEAVEKHGCLNGCCLGVKRVIKCHPFCRGGVDTVPEKI